MYLNIKSKIMMIYYDFSFFIIINFYLNRRVKGLTQGPNSGRI